MTKSEPNYVKELARLHSAGVLRPDDLTFIDVAHDDWCVIYQGKPCNCDPDVINRETGEVLNRDYSKRWELE